MRQSHGIVGSHASERQGIRVRCCAGVLICFWKAVAPSPLSVYTRLVWTGSAIVIYHDALAIP